MISVSFRYSRSTASPVVDHHPAVRWTATSVVEAPRPVEMIAAHGRMMMNVIRLQSVTNVRIAAIVETAPPAKPQAVETIVVSRPAVSATAFSSRVINPRRIRPPGRDNVCRMMTATSMSR